MQTVIDPLPTSTSNHLIQLGTSLRCCMCATFLLRPPHGLIPHQECFRSRVSCLPDFVDLLRLCLFLHFIFFIFVLLPLGDQATQLNGFFFLSVLRRETQSKVCTGCFILKTVSIFLPESISSVQLGFCQKQTYSLQSRAESHFWNTFETRCGVPGGIMSIVQNNRIQLWWPHCKQNVVQTCWNLGVRTELSSDTQLSQ